MGWLVGLWTSSDFDLPVSYTVFCLCGLKALRRVL